MPDRDTIDTQTQYPLARSDFDEAVVWRAQELKKEPDQRRERRRDDQPGTLPRRTFTS